MAGRSLFVTERERNRRIAAVMKAKGFSWYAVGKLAGRDQGALQRCFDQKYVGRGTSDPRLSSLKAIARALNVSVGFLVDKEVRR